MLNNIKSESYFYNNYLISKYFVNTKDTIRAISFAKKALTAKNELDAFLYTPLRSELNFIINKNYKISDEPYIAVNKTICDLGVVKPNEQVEAAFSIINKGKKPLIIKNIIASCECTLVNWERKPIPSGATSFIKAKLKIKKAGLFNKNLYVFSNAYNNTPLILSLKARSF
ncbi:DUF1573 domain-containing protein [Solitalea koreensis]|uniref:DUF1573 domain-containing protein n=1 Tax=Solitalea koreensis TaxID=543615 RepID=UPI00163D4D05|nr:DUF1573 domain-containing protein [Solitalea koreensis]